MANLKFDKEITALLVIDPYNDFISEKGKVWDRLRAVAEANDCVPNMLQVLTAARKAGLRVFYALHHRYRPGDYETWKYIAPAQKAAWMHKTFENGTWGGEIRREFEPQPGDIVALEHWCSSGFANTDLDLQLKEHGIHQLIVIGLLAHTCVESTVRFAAELGYQVTVVQDAIASFTDEQMYAALHINIPNYASAIVTTKEVVETLSFQLRLTQSVSADQEITMRSTAEVLDHHRKCFADRDLDGLLADYSADAVFFSSEGALRGPNAIKPVFERLFAEFAKPGASVARKQLLIEGEYAYTVWTSETADNSYELASDTFVIQNGSIRLQAFTAKVKPKY